MSEQANYMVDGVDEPRRHAHLDKGRRREGDTRRFEAKLRHKIPQFSVAAITPVSAAPRFNGSSKK